MKNRRFLGVLFLLLPVTTGFLCPSGEIAQNEKPRPPVIDSIAAGVNSFGNPGFWIYFHTDGADSNQDMRGFELFRRTSEPQDSVYRKLYTGIAPDLRRVFDDDVQFGDSLLAYEYRLLAYDSAVPPGISDTSQPKMLHSCRAPRLLTPAKDTLLTEAAQFRWAVDFLYDGFIQYIGITAPDSVIWHTQVKDPTPVIIIGNYDTISCLITKETMQGSIPSLKSGTYHWWIRVIWQGGRKPAQSVASHRFRIQ